MEYGTSGLSDWLQENVITLLLLLAVAVMLFLGLKGNISKLVTIIGCSLLALFFLGIVITPNGAENTSKFLLDLVTS